MNNNPSPNIKATIVIIDDDAQILALTTEIFSENGYRVLGASSAEKGIEIIQKNSPELALFDYIMPGMDGLTAVRLIRHRFPGTYASIFTAHGSEEIAVELMKAGASEYILKPFDADNLISRMDNVLQIREVELTKMALKQEHERLMQQIDLCNIELKQLINEKNNSLQQAHTRIEQSEKLAELGYLSAGMAHEIRNPLNSISLFSQLLLQGTTDPEQLLYINKIVKEVDRIDVTIRKMRDSANKSHRIFSRVSLNNTIDTVIDIFAPQIELNNISVQQPDKNVELAIKADPAGVEQVFINLFLNAIDEMHQGGKLTITSEIGQESIVIRVRDSGSGIPDKVLPRIFEPFFTTKTRGTGMGLSIAKRILRSFGGDIQVETTSPQGTTFKLVFMAWDENA